MSNNGTVKWFNGRKGFGFITPEGNEEGENSNDVFVHFSSIIIEEESKFKTLYENDKVTFNIVKSEKGREARDVVVTERAPRERIHKKKSTQKNSTHKKSTQKKSTQKKSTQKKLPHKKSPQKILNE